MSISPSIDSSWQYISEGVDVLMKRDLASLGLTTEVYMNMYTAIHNFCVSTHPVSTRYEASGRGHHTKLLGGELYTRLVEYLHVHLHALLAAAPSDDSGDVLAYYNRCWSRYLVGARYLDHIFGYLNRHWVKQERDEGGRRRGVYEVHTLCLVLWRDQMFVPLEQRLVPCLLAAIRRDRDGRPVDGQALQTCVQSMVAVGFDDLNSRRTNLLFYTEHFQRAFVADTAEYFRHEADAVVQSEGIVGYARRAFARLQEERYRVKRYLHPSTEDVLLAECERVLVSSRLADLQGVFLPLLRANDVETLHVVFVLLQKVPSGLDSARADVEAHIIESGMQRVGARTVSAAGESKAGANEGANEGANGANGAPSTAANAANTGATTATTANAANAADKVDPQQYVAALLDVRAAADTLLHDAFANDRLLRDAIDAGFARVVNDNPVARPEPTADSKTPELLARCADAYLKKRSAARRVSAEDTEKGVDGVLSLLKYTEEKDVFERHYQRMLARRLVLQASTSTELEASIVQRLGDACGFEYTNKLQRMFQDVATSQRLQQQFTEPGNPTNFEPIVLAKGFWPLPLRDEELVLPPQMAQAHREFAEFYDHAHNGRRLRWLWNFGRGELRLNLPQGPVVLVCSLYEMAILLAFNDHDELSRDDLKRDTRLADELLDGSLAFILRAGVLVETADGKLRFNENFHSKRTRINLNLPLKTSDAQSEKPEEQLDEQRQTFLQSVAVRIMKARKSLSHAQLVEEITQQALTRFRPNVKDVKRAIGALLDRDFLQRNGSDYEYAA